MRRDFLVLAAVLSAFSLCPTGRAHAQTGNGNLGSDPFSFYYGYYLPHQAAIAAQPTPMDTINQNIAQRQQAAIADRSSLYDPVSPYGDSEDDLLAPYSGKRGAGGRLRQGSAITNGSDHTRGNGPSMYYNRTARYFPGMKTGRGPNRNLANVRGGRGGGAGMGGMGGGMGMAMPGPR